MAYPAMNMHTNQLRVTAVWVLLGTALLCSGLPHARDTAGVALLLDIKGAITPAVSAYVLRGLAHARDQDAQLVILRMDTPGGLDSSMREIIQGILNSTVPVVGYVGPAGARAASAGTYILYASHIAAMAEATNLGAATPVSLSRVAVATAADEEAEEADEVADNATAMRRKVTNDASAYIRSLAELRDRNVEWAETAVRDGASLSAMEALRMQVVDLVAVDVPDLLDAVHGWRVEVKGGDRLLNTGGVILQDFTPTWRDRLLAVLSDPNIALLLLNLGVLAILMELYSPGLIIPGVLGVIAVLFGLYSLHILPVNFAGVALLLLGFALMAVELFVPAVGLFALTGLVAMVVGGLLLFEPQQYTRPEDWNLAVSPYLLAIVVAICVAVMLVVVPMLVRSMRRPLVSGATTLIGTVGKVMADFSGRGRVRINGEDWDATANVALKRGDAIRVCAVTGLLLRVEPELSPAPVQEK